MHARLTGGPWQAQRHYAEAIEGAAREGFIQDEALANELRGRFALRACLVNHRSTEADVDAVVAEVLAAAAG